MAGEAADAGMPSSASEAGFSVEGSVVSRMSGASARTVGTCVGPTRSPADSKRRLADGESLDITRILNGYSPGREINAAQERANGMKDGSIEQSELQAKIDCAAAAVSWHYSVILSTPAAKLIDSWRILAKEDHALPAAHMWLFTRKMAEEFAESKRLDQWKNSIWPLQEEGASQEAGLWDVVAPCFRHCGIPTDTDSEKSTQDLRNTFKQNWEDSILSNCLAVMMPGVDTAEGRKNILQYCEAFLETVTEEGIKDLPKYLLPTAEVMVGTTSRAEIGQRIKHVEQESGQGVRRGVLEVRV